MKNEKSEGFISNHYRTTTADPPPRAPTPRPYRPPPSSYRSQDVFNPCLCISLSTGTLLVAFISVFLGIGTLATSSWVLHRALQQQKNPTLTTATDLLHQVNTFFGGTTGLYDLDVIFRIFIAVSATTLGCAFVQFIMSFWLMLATVKGGRTMARIWVFVQVFVMVGIGGGFLCILTNDLEINSPTLIFLIVSGVNFVLLIFFCLVVFTFSYSDDDSDTAV